MITVKELILGALAVVLGVIIAAYVTTSLTKSRPERYTITAIAPYGPLEKTWTNCMLLNKYRGDWCLFIDSQGRKIEISGGYILEKE